MATVSYEKIGKLIEGGFVRRSSLQKVPPSTASICGQFGIPNHLAMLQDEDRVRFYKQAILWKMPTTLEEQEQKKHLQGEELHESLRELPNSKAQQQHQPQRLQQKLQSHVTGLRILEIGCGPLALLSLLAVQQGAAQVDALELNSGVYHFASTFVQQIGVNASRPCQAGVEESELQRLRVFRCYSKLFPVAARQISVETTTEALHGHSRLPHLVEESSATNREAAASSVGESSCTMENKGLIKTAAPLGVEDTGACECPMYSSKGHAVASTKCVSKASPSHVVVSLSCAPASHPHYNTQDSATELVAEGIGSLAVVPRCATRRLRSSQQGRMKRAVKRIRASPSRTDSGCTGECGCHRSKPMVRSFRLWEQSTVHQPQPNRLEGVSYDMVIHEILGDFASQEGAADVIRDIQERSATIPQSIPFAARTFVGVSELPSPCCIKCPASEHPERSVLSPRERLMQSVGLRFSETLLSSQLKAIEELAFEARMDTQMLQRRTFFFDVEREGLFAGFLAAIEIEIRPGLFFGPIYEGQCDSWYTNVVLLGREIYVSKGDKIFLKTEANLTNFQREQQMSLTGRRWVSVSRPSYTFSGEVLPQNGCSETFGPIVIDFDEQACCVQPTN